MKTKATLFAIAILALSCTSNQPTEVEQTSDFMEQSTEYVQATDSTYGDSATVSSDTTTVSDTVKASI